MDDANKQPEVTEQKTITSLAQINSIIKRNDVTYASHYVVPSLGIKVPFKEINTSQQKRLAKSIIDSSIYNTELIYTLRDILMENCNDENVIVDNLTVIDKLIISVALRIKSVGNIVKIEVQTKDNKSVNVELDLEKIYNMALKSLSDITSITYEDKYFIVECGVPTIGEEYRLEKELHGKIKEIDMEDINILRQTIGEAFVDEIVKFIKKVSIKSDDTVIPVDWDKFKYKDRVSVVETFKSTLLKDIMGYINKVRVETDKIELVNFTFGDEKFERRLSIDGNFFMIS